MGPGGWEGARNPRVGGPKAPTAQRVKVGLGTKPEGPNGGGGGGGRRVGPNIKCFSFSHRKCRSFFSLSGCLSVEYNYFPRVWSSLKFLSSTHVSG